MMTDLVARVMSLFSRGQSPLFPWLTFSNDGTGTLGSGADASDERVYDDDGLLLSRAFDRVDDLRQVDSYVDGVRASTMLLDQADQFDWAEVTNLYDETGRTRKETTFDSGMLRVDTFQGGVRVRSVQTDPDDVGLVDWATRDVTYDGSGTPLTRLTRYDDGTERFETFQEGVRSTVIQEDLVLTAQIWSKIAAIYDSLGRLTARDVAYDDGVSRSDVFSGGVRQKTTVDDAADMFDWDNIQFLYNFDGVVTSRQQIDDNGDVTLILFDDGQRQERVIVDENDDMDWAVQITTYDESGVSDVAEYAEWGNVLGDYAPFFAEDVMIFSVG